MDVFVARQPIFNQQEQVTAYELLYRHNLENTATFSDGDQATIDVLLNSFVHIGLNELAMGNHVYVNFTENLLLKDIPSNFSNDQLVVEILENTLITDELIEVIKKLKEDNYVIALDDFVSIKHYKLLIPYADIIKVDFQNTTYEDRQVIKHYLKDNAVSWLAEKVETREQFLEAKKEGYDFFQGYFFCKPDIIQGKSVPSFFQSYATLFQELSAEEPDIEKIRSIIEGDLSLSYNLLKLMNHTAYTRRFKVTSIQQAIMQIGLRELRKWLTLIILKKVDHRCADEIIRTLLTRAKTLEMIAKKMKMDDPAELFLLGMFSMIDTLLSIPMEDILKTLPLDDKLSNGLLYSDNYYNDLLNLVLLAETGMWEETINKAQQLNISMNFLSKAFHEALEWSDSVMAVNDEYENSQPK